MKILFTRVREFQWGFISIVVLLFLVFGALNLSISQAYPYYFMWDMDHCTVLDQFVLAEGKIPGHINHPSFGMYVLFHISQRVAHFFNIISASTFVDLANALTPPMLVAELTDYLRRHSPISVIFITAFCWLSVNIVYNLPVLFSVLILTYFGSLYSLFYHSNMIRSELYAVLYWAGAMLFVSLAVSTMKPDRSKRMMAYVFLAGVFAGLSLLTKFQSVIHVLMLPLVFVFFCEFRDRSAAFVQLPKANRKTTLYVAILNTSLFLWILIGGLRTVVPAQYGTFVTSPEQWGLSLSGGVFLFIALALLLTAIIDWRARKVPFILSHAWPLHYYFGGFISAFLMHLLILPKIHIAYKYMLFDSKMIFGRNVYRLGSGFGALLAYGQGALNSAMDNPVVVLGLCLLGLVVIFKRPKGRRWSVIALVLTTIAIFAFSTRGSSKDFIWIELVAGCVTLMFGASVLAPGGSANATSRKSCLLVYLTILSMILYNLYGLSQLRTWQDAQAPLRGWQRTMVLFHMFGTDQEDYRTLIENNYGNQRSASATVASDFARNHNNVTRLVRFTFPNQKLPSTHIGAVYPGFRVWVDDSNSRIDSVPNQLRNMITVDNAALPSVFYNHDLLKAERVPHDMFSAIKRTISGSHDYPLVVVPRADTEVYIFLTNRDASVFDELTRTLVPTVKSAAESISVRNKTETRWFKSYRFTALTQFNPSLLKDRYFFVIRQL